jgi:hypothetical protein
MDSRVRAAEKMSPQFVAQWWLPRRIYNAGERIRAPSIHPRIITDLARRSRNSVRQWPNCEASFRSSTDTEVIFRLTGGDEWQTTISIAAPQRM